MFRIRWQAGKGWPKSAVAKFWKKHSRLAGMQQARSALFRS